MSEWGRGSVGAEIENCGGRGAGHSSGKSEGERTNFGSGEAFKDHADWMRRASRISTGERRAEGGVGRSSAGWFRFTFGSADEGETGIEWQAAALKTWQPKHRDGGAGQAPKPRSGAALPAGLMGGPLRVADLFLSECRSAGGGSLGAAAGPRTGRDHYQRAHR